MQLVFSSVGVAFLLVLSQSPYGAKWFATEMLDELGVSEDVRSQSPYGAKWFATKEVRHEELGEDH